jgi:dihydrofolate reductase
LPSESLTLVAALAKNRAIGNSGAMPWHLPAELAHFKKTTMGKPILMGRRTWESIGRPLPGRQNIVLTRSAGFEAEGCDVVTSLEAALAVAGGDEVMVIGGGELYRLALPLAGKMILTLIDIEPEADTWFPQWAEDEWKEVSSEVFVADEKNPLNYEIVTLVRIS